VFKRVFERIEGEVSGEAALNLVYDLSRYHRIQGSPGLRDAVSYAVETLRGYGLEAEVRRYPADGKTYFWSNLMFKEWSCRDAELRLIEPREEARVLARWSDSRFSLIQRSHPTPADGLEAELVVLEDGEEESEYEGLNLEGRIVLTRGDVSRVYELAVERRGAVGIIYDGMRAFPPVRREGDLDDALQYTSFWWAGDERPAFGFVLSPRRGRWLRELAKKRMERGESLRLWARVDSCFYEGTMENALAAIRGETDEEVLLLAHICHPQPSSNDNASGCAAVMEAARALQRLITRGELPRPRRTIRFMLMPEMTGTYAWLTMEEDRIGRIVAALNLDMVGENQNLCGGPLIIERTPMASPSYTDTLLEAILEKVKVEGRNLSGTARYALFKYAVTPFSGGSDHYILSDPSVGIPCPMIIQWPDRFYHTSYDTPDKVDPEMLRKVALMAATYAYFIANAGPEEAIWLLHETATKKKMEIASAISAQTTLIIEEAERGDPAGRASDALRSLEDRVRFLLDRGIEAVRSIRRFGENPAYRALEERQISELEAFAKGETSLARQTIEEYLNRKGINLTPKVDRGMKGSGGDAASIIPKRIYRGPPSTRSWIRRLPREDRDALWRLEKEHRESRILGTLALYWADGKRSLSEIANLIELETGMRDTEYLLQYFGFLEKMGLIQIERREQSEIRP
jgi:aminopeptidase YwaD